MLHLILVSFLWAFSFGLTKGRLAGLDSAFISAARLSLALLVFLPFLRLRGLAPRHALSLAAIGAVQFGLMYLAYNQSFLHLKAHEVALFTLTTPLFVTLFADALDRTLHPRSLLAALLSCAAVATLHRQTLAATWTGFALVQLSNAAFALGQILYCRHRLRHPGGSDHACFALLYLGAVAVTLPVALAQSHVNPLALPASQAWTLLYLGVLASGLGFFLWNKGATRVHPGALAVFNNAKIPLAVACSLLFFGETVDSPLRLLASAALLLGAVWITRRR